MAAPEWHSDEQPADTKTSQARLSFGLKDILDWSEMEVATTYF